MTPGRRALPGVLALIATPVPLLLAELPFTPELGAGLLLGGTAVILLLRRGLCWWSLLPAALVSIVLLYRPPAGALPDDYRPLPPWTATAALAATPEHQIPKVLYLSDSPELPIWLAELPLAAAITAVLPPTAGPEWEFVAHRYLTRLPGRVVERYLEPGYRLILLDLAPTGVEARRRLRRQLRRLLAPGGLVIASAANAGAPREFARRRPLDPAAGWWLLGDESSPQPTPEQLSGLLRARLPSGTRPFSPQLLPVLRELTPPPPEAPPRSPVPLAAGLALAGYWLVRLLLGRQRSLPKIALRFETALAAGLLLLAAAAATAGNRWFDPANPLLLLALGALVLFPGGRPAVWVTIPAALTLAVGIRFGLPAWGSALLLVAALPGIGELWRRGRGVSVWWGLPGVALAALLGIWIPDPGPAAALAAGLLLPAVFRL